MIRTPNNLDVLIHCHCSTEEHPRADAPAVQEAYNYLANSQMICRDLDCIDSDRWTTTEKGDAYIKHLLSIPFPEIRWVIPTE